MSTLADLYEQYGPRLYRYAVLILADAAAAEDVVQEAFCALARVTVHQPTAVTAAYLTAVVRNACYDRLRSRRRWVTSDGGSMLEPAARDASADERLIVEAALRQLPAEQREVIYLKVYEGLTFQEIGERCDVSVNTAASRYRYALEALRRTFEVDRAQT